MPETEQLLLDTGFHPNTARAFDVAAVRAELPRQDVLAWLPQEERGRLVLRWRRVSRKVDGDGW